MFKISGMLYREVLSAAKTLNCCISSHIHLTNLTSCYVLVRAVSRVRQIRPLVVALLVGDKCSGGTSLTHLHRQERPSQNTWEVHSFDMEYDRHMSKMKTNLRFLKTSITFLKLNCHLSSHIYIAQNHKVIHLPQMALQYHKISLYPSLDKEMLPQNKNRRNSGGICYSKSIYRLMASAYPYTPHPVLCGRCVWVCYIPQAFFSPINTQEKKGNILPTVHPLKD